MPRASEKHKISICFVKVRSINDLCRYIYNFDFTSENVFLDKNRIVAFGESVDDTTIAYYADFELKNKVDTIKYVSPSNGNPEEVEFINQNGQLGTFWINIIDMDIGTISKNKKIGTKNLTRIRLGGVSDIVKTVIRKSAKYESLTHLYSFDFNGSSVICGFDLVDKLDSEKGTFYYAIVDKMPVAKFIRYNYTDNKIDFTENVGEHNYMYIKMINLAEPFPFAKDLLKARRKPSMVYIS